MCSLSYPALTEHVPYYIVACPPPPHFSKYLIYGTIFVGRGIIEHKMCVLSLQLLSENFLILKRIQQDIVINVKTSHVKYPLFLSDFNETWIFSTQISQKY